MDQVQKLYIAYLGRPADPTMAAAIEDPTQGTMVLKKVMGGRPMSFTT
jgi:hypothetical protein